MNLYTSHMFNIFDTFKQGSFTLRPGFGELQKTILVRTDLDFYVHYKIVRRYVRTKLISSLRNMSPTDMRYIRQVHGIAAPVPISIALDQITRKISDDYLNVVKALTMCGDYVSLFEKLGSNGLYLPEEIIDTVQQINFTKTAFNVHQGGIMIIADNHRVNIVYSKSSEANFSARLLPYYVKSLNESLSLMRMEKNIRNVTLEELFSPSQNTLDTVVKDIDLDEYNDFTDFKLSVGRGHTDETILSNLLCICSGKFEDNLITVRDVNLTSNEVCDLVEEIQLPDPGNPSFYEPPNVVFNRIKDNKMLMRTSEVITEEKEIVDNTREGNVGKRKKNRPIREAYTIGKNKNLSNTNVKKGNNKPNSQEQDDVKDS